MALTITQSSAVIRGYKLIEENRQSSINFRALRLLTPLDQSNNERYVGDSSRLVLKIQCISRRDGKDIKCVTKSDVDGFEVYISRTSGPQGVRLALAARLARGKTPFAFHVLHLSGE